MIEVKLLTPSAKMPTRGSEQAAGLDLYADDDNYVVGATPTAFPTGVSVRIPEGFVGLVQPRSGLAFHHDIDTLAGVIDSDYRGEIKVLLANHGQQSLTIYAGERIAQLLIMPILMCTPIKVDELDATERGESGFGSTGKN